MLDETCIIYRKGKGNGVIEKGEGTFVKNIVAIEKMDRDALGAKGNIPSGYICYELDPEGIQ